jgi:hypothetical protein
MSQLRDQLKQKLESKKGAGKENEGPNMGMQTTAKIIPSNDVKFSKMSGDSDLNLMISKSREEIQHKIT